MAEGVTIGIILQRQPHTAALIRKLMLEHGVPIDDSANGRAFGVR
jgi:hypothetical protein